MADKTYYWLKLKRDFFKRHDVRIIEAMPNGKDMVLFYLKMLCESIDHGGRLRFSDEIPYTPEMLASITETEKDVAKQAMGVLESLGLLEELEDGTFFLTKAESMIGNETDWARKKREYRESSKTDEGQKEDTARTSRGQTEDKSRTKKDNVRQEIESEIESDIEIESEKELEKEKEKKTRESVDYQLVADLYNETCVSFPRLTSLSDARKKAIRARLNNYTVEDFQRLFEKAEASAFLKGANDRNWTATFDWLIKDGNMAKVLDGNYDARNSPGNRTARNLEESYDMMRSWAEGGG